MIVPPITLSSIFLEIGKLSPVIIDSSTLQLPSIILPSIGTISPVLTMSISLTFVSSIFISSTNPSTSLLAIVCCILDRSLMDEVVFLMELCSNKLPKSTKVIIVAQVSKNM